MLYGHEREWPAPCDVCSQDPVRKQEEVISFARPIGAHQEKNRTLQIEATESPRAEVKNESLCGISLWRKVNCPTSQGFIMEKP